MDNTELFVVKTAALGMAVRLERTRRGWRQLDLAKRAGVTQAEVSSLERGLYIIPAARRRVLHTLDFETEPERP